MSPGGNGKIQAKMEEISMASWKNSIFMIITLNFHPGHIESKKQHRDYTFRINRRTYSKFFVPLVVKFPRPTHKFLAPSLTQRNFKNLFVTVLLAPSHGCPVPNGTRRLSESKKL